MVTVEQRSKLTGSRCRGLFLSHRVSTDFTVVEQKGLTLPGLPVVLHWKEHRRD